MLLEGRHDEGLRVRLHSFNQEMTEHKELSADVLKPRVKPLHPARLILATSLRTTVASSLRGERWPLSRAVGI